ncbi:hypothetical protein BDY19DRAFT_973641 [Irpex rosettiformis]|uniref:Uncharacterized protein n=1 Tax=Irpex rosettiformis TaxID=378272 RepID=A0ACB8TQ92_9APHY|nr:hypothetical protein BDY19DRAFT_973641 [Irpex rosettiformis]
MLNRSLPYFLEDRTGIVSRTTFDDIYDRLFLSIDPSSSSSTVTISSSPRRASSHTDSTQPRRLSSYAKEADSPSTAVTLHFGQRGTLGSVVFPDESVVPMASWLKKTGLFSGSLSRKFTASDGEEYRWVYQSATEHEWTLIHTQSNLTVAHYIPKPPHKTAYGTSGNVLTIYEVCGGVAVEILASLTVMRYIAANGL